MGDMGIRVATHRHTANKSYRNIWFAVFFVCCRDGLKNFRWPQNFQPEKRKKKQKIQTFEIQEFILNENNLPLGNLVCVLTIQILHFIEIPSDVK